MQEKSMQEKCQRRSFRREFYVKFFQYSQAVVGQVSQVVFFWHDPKRIYPINKCPETPVELSASKWGTKTITRARAEAKV